ncbi:MAG: phosphate ABC transporter permease subunit PstC [Clostridia bacterium]|nr:phosphate ABC transporter permease subunit PstC [Clostridia bacterium]
MKKFGELMIEKLLLVSSAMAIVVILLIFLFLFKEALPLLTPDNWSRLLSTNWYPNAANPEFGLLPLLLSSLLITFGAIAIAVPVGIATAIYLAEIAHPKIREILKPAIEILAGIPSVVLGFFALVAIVPWVRTYFELNTGLTALTGSLILAVMALPTIVTVAEDAISSVPDRYKAASLSLGATHWQTIVRAIVPAALSGITAGIMLGIGRAIGETMAVMMVTGNAAVIPDSFLVPVRTMTATIAAEMGEVPRGSNHYHALFVVGLVLFAITFTINLIADTVRRRLQEVE